MGSHENEWQIDRLRKRVDFLEDILRMVLGRVGCSRGERTCRAAWPDYEGEWCDVCTARDAMDQPIRPAGPTEGKTTR